MPIVEEEDRKDDGGYDESGDRSVNQPARKVAEEMSGPRVRRQPQAL